MNSNENESIDERIERLRELRKKINEGHDESIIPAYKRKGVNLKNNTYDIFISAKNLDESGELTIDKKHASNIYEYLTQQNYRVFLSTFSLEEMGVTAYKEVIDQALDSAKILILVCSSAEYANSKWVKYEWDSFFNDILSDLKPEGRILVYLIEESINNLPRALRQIHCIQHGPESIATLERFIRNSNCVEKIARYDLSTPEQSSDNYLHKSCD